MINVMNDFSPSPMRPMDPFTAVCPFRLRGGEGEDDKSKETEGADSGKDSGADSDKEKEPSDHEKEQTEIERLQADLAAERQNRIALENERDKNLEDQQKANQTVESERDDYKQKYEKLLAYVEKDGLENAINKLSSSKNKEGQPLYEWADVEAVRVFINPEKIRLNLEDHQVDGLADELKRIAKEKPYLLVQKQVEQDDQRHQGPQSGGHPGGSSRQSQTDRDRLGNKYKIPGFATAAASARPI